MPETVVPAQFMKQTEEKREIGFALIFVSNNLK